MRILLANYRYFVSGGPERYLFNVSSALVGRGHEVIPFSIDYARNLSTPYSKYFAKPIGGRDEVYFKNQKTTPQSVIKTLSRVFYAPDVEGAVTRLVNESKPDVAYVLHYLRKLSPSLLVGLKKAGLPVVVRLSDYQMLCPQAHFLRDSVPCQLCMTGNLLPSIRHKCVQGSLGASLINASATWFHRLRRYFDLIDVFVVTNPFMKRMMVSAGYPERRLRLIPTFVDTDAFKPLLEIAGDGFVAYAGRLEFIKGVHVLLASFARFRQLRPESKWKLKLAGDGDERYVDSLRHQATELQIDDHVEFVGNLDKNQLAAFLGQARLTVIPSLWYENLPNVLLESYSAGTPVLASALGSLNVAVLDAITGYRFEAANVPALAERLAYLWDSPDELLRMSGLARHIAETEYSAAAHVPSLEALFHELTSAGSPKLKVNT